MRLQDTQANCGPASLSNALAALGLTKSQAECEVLCKTSGTDGTSVKGLQNAIRTLGYRAQTLNERRWEVAWLKLNYLLHAGSPVLLCVDKSEHWVAAIGTIGPTPRILVADPADNELVLSLAADQLKARWLSSNRYFGVTL